MKEGRSQEQENQEKEQEKKEQEKQTESEYEAPRSADEAKTRTLVNVVDVIIPLALAFRADDLDNQKVYKATADAKRDIVEALMEYQQESGQVINVPIWLHLVFVVGVAYTPAFMHSSKVRKQNKAAKNRASSPFENNSQGASIIEYYDSNGNLSTGYWDQEIQDPTSKVKENPISESENAVRKEKGGNLCANCGENYTKPGKVTCGQHCSGKYQTSKLNS